jgi:hypothetical protein
MNPVTHLLEIISWQRRVVLGRTSSTSNAVANAQQARRASVWKQFSFDTPPRGAPFGHRALPICWTPADGN